MHVINALLLIAGGILALSGLIVAKRPDAKQYIDKLVPYQALIGVGLLVLGVLSLLSWIGPVMFHALGQNALFAITFLAMPVCSIGLGLMFGMPLISKWMGGQHPNAEQKAAQLMAKILPYQIVIGGVGIIAGVLVLGYTLHIVPQTF